MDVGGQFAGRTPLTTMLPTGTYEVVATSEESGFAEQEATINADETTSVSLGLSLEEGLNAYTDDDGVVDTNGLRVAIDDWRSGDIDTDLLRQVIQAWRSNDQVT